jgi:hypothetical protein
MTRMACMTDAQSTVSGLYVLPATVPLILATCEQVKQLGSTDTLTRAHKPCTRRFFPSRPKCMCRSVSRCCRMQLQHRCIAGLFLRKVLTHASENCMPLQSQQAAQVRRVLGRRSRTSNICSMPHALQHTA